jgi:hypothetical protein
VGFGRLALVLIAALALSGASYVFAAANVVPATRAGDGNNTISGYTITSVVYTLNATSPFNIDSVAFTAAPIPTAGSKMRIKLVSAGTTWYNCTDAVANGNLTCATTAPQATVATANELRVIIAD